MNFSNIVQGAVSLIFVVAIGFAMFFMGNNKGSEKDYSAEFSAVDNRLESLGTQMLSQGDAISALKSDFDSLKLATSDFDSGGSDESIKDESTWDPGTSTNSGGGSSGSVISSNVCNCDPCTCSNVSMAGTWSPGTVVSSSYGSNGGYSSSVYSQPTTQVFRTIRSSRPRRVISQPVFSSSRSTTCVNGQCFLN